MADEEKKKQNASALEADMKSAELKFSEKDLIKQGAEARVYRCVHAGRPVIVKERFKKGYRHPELDRKLTNQRLASEARCLSKAVKLGVDVPIVYLVDTERRILVIECLAGLTCREYLLPLDLTSEKEKECVATLAKKIGTSISKLHAGGIVHGDLTTSNMFIREGPAQSLCMIDFGLAFVAQSVEDFAVDLYVLERALLATHPNSHQMFANVGANGAWLDDSYGLSAGYRQPGWPIAA